MAIQDTPGLNGRANFLTWCIFWLVVFSLILSLLTVQFFTFCVFPLYLFPVKSDVCFCTQFSLLGFIVIVLHFPHVPFVSVLGVPVSLNYFCSLCLTCLVFSYTFPSLDALIVYTRMFTFPKCLCVYLYPQFVSVLCHVILCILYCYFFHPGRKRTPGSFIITLIYYCEHQQFTSFPRQSVDQLLIFLTQSHSCAKDKSVGIHLPVMMVLGYFYLNKVFLQLIIKQLNVMTTFKPLC